MVRGPRPLSNNVRACVDNISDLCATAWAATRLAGERAAHYRDPDLLAAIVTITRSIAEIRQQAANVRTNTYEEPRP